ncbi:MAG: zinc-binding dehydrogenase [Planococcus sp. (in: Bacteria)]|nr:zinc-binding dehydrogenase [Planococcus sp. (in: firmicutes)]
MDHSRIGICITFSARRFCRHFVKECPGPAKIFNYALTYFGAEVTAVCSARNVELVKSLGADRVIDCNIQNFTDSSETCGIIFDTIGKSKFSQCRSTLKEKGIYLSSAARMSDFALMISTSAMNNKRLIGGLAPMRKKDLLFLKD